MRKILTIPQCDEVRVEAVIDPATGGAQNQIVDGRSPGEKGGPWQQNSTEKAWTTFRYRAGLPVDLLLYDLRRTYASYLSIHGKNLPIIQNVLNHRSLALTSIYTRLNTKAVDRALQAQADRFSSLQETHTLSIVPPEDSADDRVIHIGGTEQPHMEHLEPVALGGRSTRPS